MASFIVDTNFFLQHRAAAELPWGEITPDQDVVLMVPRAVQSELDRLKQDGSARRAARARAACSLIRRALISGGEEFTLRASGPSVRLKILRVRAPPNAIPAGLDLTYSDDQLVADALHLGVPLLSGDGGPLTSAGFHGAQWMAIPETWALPPEPDKESKEVAQLRLRVDALERSSPQITAQFLRAGSEVPLEELIIRVFVFEVSESDLDAAVGQLRDRFPPVDRPNARRARSMLIADSMLTAPSEEDFVRYETRYEEWLKAARAVLRGLIAKQSEESRRLPLDILLTNDGTRPAENVMVELIAHGQLQFEDPDPREEIPPIIYPSPPPGPAWRLKPIFTLPSIPVMTPWVMRPNLALDAFPMVDPLRRRDEFAWDEASAQLLKSVCIEFRHQVAPERLEIELVAPAEEGRTGVRVRVSASNLPHPEEKTLKVVVELERRSGAELLDELVGSWPKAEREKNDVIDDEQ